MVNSWACGTGSSLIEQLQGKISKPSVKQYRAAIRMLFDYLVIVQVVPFNPASSVRGPKYITKKGKTPVLSAEEARELLDSIRTDTVVGLRDRALISLMVYTFARVGAAVGMTVEDNYPQHRRYWVRRHEKSGKRHEMPAHHNLDTYLAAYIDAAGIGEDKQGPLFRTTVRRTGELTRNRLA